MAFLATEQVHPNAIGLDQRPPAEIAQLLAAGQVSASRAVLPSLNSICEGAALMAQAILEGGVLHYVGAGSSGLMAAADAMELGGTFSIPSNQIRIHMAGGLPRSSEMPGATEDEVEGLEVALSSLSVRDVVIAVTASGSTPFTLAAAKIACDRDTKVIGIANNPNVALFETSTCPILLETPPEIVSGSTRMGAATSQKIALNLMSTLMAVRLGHVHDGMMVNLQADNKKLRQRATFIVMQIARVTEQAARKAIDAAEGDLKTAILIAEAGITRTQAQDRLVTSRGHLRPVLATQRTENT